MSHNIDEISKILGTIQADVVHIRRNTELTDAKMDKITESVIRQDSSIKSAHKRIDEIKPTVENLNTLRNKAIGVLTVISVFFTFLGSFISKVFTNFFG